MTVMRGDRYDFTATEIADVAVARLKAIHYAAFLCQCGCIKLWITRDTGIVPGWAAAANVVHRLSYGAVIDGRLD